MAAMSWPDKIEKFLNSSFLSHIDQADNGKHAVLDPFSKCKILVFVEPGVMDRFK